MCEELEMLWVKEAVTKGMQLAHVEELRSRDIISVC